MAPKGFFPQQDTGQIQGGLRADQSISFQAMQDKLRQLVNIMRADPAVDTVVGFTGGSRAGGGFVFINLKPSRNRNERGQAVIARLRPKLAQVTGVSLFLNPVQDVRAGGRQTNSTYQYTLKSDNLADLRLWATKLAEAMKQQPALTDVDTDQQDNGVEVYVDVNMDTAARLGITARDVDNALYDAFGQRQVATIYSELNQYHVVMGVAQAYARSPNALDDIYVPARGTPGTLSTAVGFGASTAPSGGSGGAGTVRGSLGGVTTNLAAGLPLGSSLSSGTGGSASSNAAGGAPTAAGGGGSSGNGSSNGTSGTSGTGTNAASGTTASSTSAAATNSGGGGTTASANGTTSTGATGTTTTSATTPINPGLRDQATGQAVSAQPTTMVPLSAFARFSERASPTAINHQDAELATTVSFNLADGRSLSDGERAVRQAEADIGMPTNVRGSFQGTALQAQQSNQQQPMLILAALVVIYIVLGVLYESLVHPITVLSTLPSAGVGAVLALLLFHLDLSIIALIGVFLLIGIVKKNAILIIDFALDAERSRGLSPYAAVREASLLRFRPILMTTLAAGLGALPLAVGFGEGAELRRPLGIAIIGGLIASQVITLLTTPVVYLLLDKLRRRSPLERQLGRHVEAATPTT
jgi:multidrug efflux pump